MKQGKSLMELVRELERQRLEKKDYVADTRNLKFILEPKEVTDKLPLVEEFMAALEIEGVGKMGLNELTHRQIGERVGIPSKYYDKMRNLAPELLVSNVNHWFKNKPEGRMIRTLDGKARAFLSDKYRRLDNYDLAEAVLPTLADIPDLEIKSCEVTENKLYIKAITPRIEGEIKKGDIVQAGLVISNSEVGTGSFSVDPMVYRLVCSNGMVAKDYGMKKLHVGRRVEVGNAAAEFFADETLQADDKAFWLQARDIVRASVSDVILGKVIRDMQAAGEQKVEGDPIKAVELLQEAVSLTQEEGRGVLTHFLQDGDLSKLGMANAVTRTSQDITSYDRASKLEELGHSILKLDQTSWKRIAQVA